MDAATCFRMLLGVTFVATLIFLATSKHPCERYILIAALTGEVLATLGEVYINTWVSQAAHITFAVCLFLSVFFVKQTCVMYYIVAMVAAREVTRFAYGKCLFEHGMERPTNQLQAGIIHAAFFAIGSIFVFKIVNA